MPGRESIPSSVLADKMTMGMLSGSNPVAAVQIDASAHCQLACPLCPTADGRTRAGMSQGHLKVEKFRALLEANPGLAHVEFSNYGEMFLNPELPELLQCAWEHNVTVSGGNGVNLNHARPEALEAVVKYRVRTLTCSLDGATPETYAKYRVNGNLERVLEHIDAIRSYRRAHGSAFPLLDWQFVVFGHNEGELEQARAIAASRGMGFLPRLSWDSGFSPVRNPELVRIATGTGAADRDEYREKQGRGYTREICYQLWRQPVLNWDGRVMGCCVNYWQDFGGNAFGTTLDEAMRLPRLEYARQMLMGRAEPQPDIPCSRCFHYEEIRQSGDWLTNEEVSGQRAAAGAAEPDHLVGLVLLPGARACFAQVVVLPGGGENQAPLRRPGRLFRFGVDTAAYFRPPAPGPYSVFVWVLGSEGWEPVRRWQLNVVARPLCQQWTLDLGSQQPQPGAMTGRGGSRPEIPVGIR